MNDPILHVRTGSLGYGTNVEGSDEDEAMIFVETSDQVFAPHREPTRIQHVKSEGVDRQVYPLRHFIRLAVKGNPTALEMFWLPIIYADPNGLDLLELGPKLIGRHIIPGYRGFIKAQTMRLLGLKGQLRVTRAELRSQDGYDTKYAMHCTRLAYQCVELLTTGRLRLPLDVRSDGFVHELMRIRRGEVPFDEWFEEIVRLDHHLGDLVHVESWPEGPDVEAAVKLSTALHLRSWLG